MPNTYLPTAQRSVAWRSARVMNKVRIRNVRRHRAQTYTRDELHPSSIHPVWASGWRDERGHKATASHFCRNTRTPTPSRTCVLVYVIRDTCRKFILFFGTFATLHVGRKGQRNGLRYTGYALGELWRRDGVSVSVCFDARSSFFLEI